MSRSWNIFAWRESQIHDESVKMFFVKHHAMVNKPTPALKGGDVVN